MADLASDLRKSLSTLLSELIDGPSERAAFVLNRGDRGLLASLDLLSAESASARAAGRASIAAHVDHLRYGLELLNRWVRGEDPWHDANFAASWQRLDVDAAQWSDAARRAQARGRRLESRVPRARQLGRIVDHGSVRERGPHGVPHGRDSTDVA